MNPLQVVLVAKAAKEFADDGIVSTTTYIALGLEGLDADSIIAILEEE